MNICETLQDRVLEDGVEAAAATPELSEHVAQCPDCTRFLNDLKKLTGALHALPVVDAPDALAEQTARRVSQSETAQPEPQRKQWRYSFLPYAASGMVAFVVATITMQAYPPYTARLQDFELAEREDVQFPATYHNDGLLADAGISRSTLESLAETEPLNQMLFGADTLSDRDATALGTKQRMKKNLLAGSEQKLDELTASGLAGAGSFMDERRNYQQRELKEQDGRLDDNGARFRLGKQPPAPAPQSEAEPETSRKSEFAASPSVAESVAPAEPVPQPETMPVDDAKHANEKNLPAMTQGPARQPVARDLSVTGQVGDSIVEGEAYKPSNQRGQALARAEAFLADLEKVDGLNFMDPSGYWRNTYVPGDPALRLLRMRMGLWNSVPEFRDARLGEAVRAIRQPLDVPENAAMGLYLQADKAAVSGVSRLRLQVGLKGAERKGVRPTMNVSVVVDLSATAQQPSVQQVRAIIAALSGAQQPGDRFSLSAAGEDGGLLVEAGDFRHGPLQVALSRLFSSEIPSTARAVSLAGAIQIAADAARSGDDPSAVFGSSVVLLITGGVAEGLLPELQTIAHRNAVGGITLSVIGTRNSGVLGAGVVVLERLVAAGQGQRRTMLNVDDAGRVIDAELHAASRAVARAARLRIRLAPGVQLLDVLGSQRLDDPQAERVREAEKSIDQRLSRNLGIRADRGEDEDGIQIVIPNFHGGDSHVILLDVLVDGPGPVADVTLRYKDLVHLKNGVTRAELRLASGDRGPGPLQRNVLKNRIAFELAQAAHNASGYLERGDMPSAVRTLLSVHDLLVGLRGTVNGWSSDGELLADTSAVADYIAYLQTHTPTHPFIHRYAVESLRYMALRKLTATNEEPQR